MRREELSLLSSDPIDFTQLLPGARVLVRGLGEGRGVPEEWDGIWGTVVGVHQGTVTVRAEVGTPNRRVEIRKPLPLGAIASVEPAAPA